MNFRHAIPLLAAILGGCAAQGTVNNDVFNKISLCSAGHRQTIGLDIDAKINQDIRTGGHVSAALSNEIKGLFLNDPNLPPADRLSAYQAYIACVERI